MLSCGSLQGQRRRGDRSADRRAERSAVRDVVCSVGQGGARGGFTLVELLVVIGIIAVLISILLPTLSVVRRQANTLKCLSNLRQLGLAFHAYSHVYKGAMPVLRQDYPDFGGVISNGQNVWWQDFVSPYVTKGVDPNASATSAQQFGMNRNSVMWGCPSWEGWPGQDAYTFKFGVSRFENGYTMNYWPSFKSDYPPSVSALPPKTESQMRWAATFEGRYNKMNQWSRPSERMLLADATLWLMNFTPTDTAGTLAQQDVGRVVPSGTGSSSIDRYRHGKYPRISGAKYLPTASGGGREMYNVLFVDGHATTLQSYKDGYIAIRMRYP